MSITIFPGSQTKHFLAKEKQNSEFYSDITFDFQLMEKIYNRLSRKKVLTKNC